VGGAAVLQLALLQEQKQLFTGHLTATGFACDWLEQLGRTHWESGEWLWGSDGYCTTLLQIDAGGRGWAAVFLDDDSFARWLPEEWSQTGVAQQIKKLICHPDGLRMEPRLLRATQMATVEEACLF